MEHFFINNGDLFKKINYNEIFYFMRENAKTYAILKDTRIEIRTTMNYISEKLEGNFIRTHKSYIVNADKIDSIQKRSQKTFNITFTDIESKAVITKKNMKVISERYKMI